MPSQFWSMTPVEYGHAVDGFSWRQEQETWRMASIVAAIYDQNRDRKKRRKPITAEDILGRKRKAGARTPEEQLAVLRNITRRMGGVVIEASPPAASAVR